MKTATFLTSSCRYCRHFHSEGRRGGTCQQLGVAVGSDWKACVLATHAFTTPWDHYETLVQLEKSLGLASSESTKKESIPEPISV